MDVAIGLGLIAAMIIVVVTIVVFLLKLVFAIIALPFRALAAIFRPKAPPVTRSYSRPSPEPKQDREETKSPEKDEWKYDFDYYRRNPGS